MAFEPITREEDLPGSEFPSYWTRALGSMMEAYHQICAYTCFRIHRVTGARSVDHMAPKSRVWSQAYEWGNYRLCCARMNARKGNFSDVLDPFEVRPGWFELELVGFQLFPSHELKPALRARIQQTIDRLRLNDTDCCRTREEHWRCWEEGDVGLDYLERASPLVARAIRRALG